MNPSSGHLQASGAKHEHDHDHDLDLEPELEPEPETGADAGQKPEHSDAESSEPEEEKQARAELSQKKLLQQSSNKINDTIKNTINQFIKSQPSSKLSEVLREAASAISKPVEIEPPTVDENVDFGASEYRYDSPDIDLNNILHDVDNLIGDVAPSSWAAASEVRDLLQELVIKQKTVANMKNLTRKKLKRLRV